MNLVVFSHKPCWRSAASPSGYATDGGFAFQIQALSELFDSTTLLVPCVNEESHQGEIFVNGHRLRVVPTTVPWGIGIGGKVAFPFWLACNCCAIVRAFCHGDAVHAPIPSDIGTVGMLLALAFRRPLLVRYCGNWHVQRTLAERLWHLLMEHFAGDRNVMLATGGMVEPPSPRNPSIRWVFSTSLWQSELEAYGRHHRSLAKDQLRLVIACRQEKGKGVETVIDALPIVQARFPQVTLDIIGDGTALVNLKERAKARGLEKRVHFHGRITHDAVISQLRQSDVFCFPTASEGFPKAVLEALACGLPVIATRVSVLPQLLGEGCGFLLDSVSPESLADAVLECASDHSRYEVMSGLALRAARRYSLESWRDLIGGWLTEAWGPLRRHV